MHLAEIISKIKKKEKIYAPNIQYYQKIFKI